MKNKIIPTNTFKKAVKKLNKRYPSLPNDLIIFEKDISQNPNLGVDFGNGIRKVRISIKSKGKGSQLALSPEIVDHCEVMWNRLLQASRSQSV